MKASPFVGIDDAAIFGGVMTKMSLKMSASLAANNARATMARHISHKILLIASSAMREHTRARNGISHGRREYANARQADGCFLRMNTRRYACRALLRDGTT